MVINWQTYGQVDRQKETLGTERETGYRNRWTDKRDTGIRDRWTDRQTQIDAHKQTECLTFKFTDIHMDR
jgi:hypothetical protein